MKFTKTKKYKDSSYTGVLKTPQGWYASILVKGNKIKSKIYKTEIGAAQAYDKLKKKHQPNCTSYNFMKSDKKSIKMVLRDKPKKKCKPLKGHCERIKLPQCFRNKICSRQGWRCKLCDKLFQDLYIIDHIRPLSLGGTNEINNLQSICPSCDKWKTGVFDWHIKSVSNNRPLTLEEIMDRQTNMFKSAKYANIGNVIKIQNENETIETSTDKKCRNMTMSAHGVTFSVTIPI